MATTPAMSLGSRAVAPGALRGRRDARKVRIGYGPVRAETSPRDGARANVADAPSYYDSNQKVKIAWLWWWNRFDRE